ncbi:MAG: HepT-like ribonuclease domain-containing protein [Planctomycetota bacterium]
MIATQPLYDAEALRKWCVDRGVKRMWLFGSVARGDAAPDSDVDVLIEYLPDGGPQGWDYFGVEDELAPIFGGRDVDFADVKTLRSWVRPRIGADRRLVFEDGVVYDEPMPKDDADSDGRITQLDRDHGRMCHVLESARGLATLTPDVEEDDFLDDMRERMAWVHLIQIIGEASGKISDDTRAKVPAVPWPKVVGLRHRIVHDYNQIDYPMVYRIATTEIDPLIEALSAYLREAGVDCEALDDHWKP